MGVPCSICGGTGVPGNVWWWNSVSPALAVLIVLCSLGLAWYIAAQSSELRNSVLTFIGTLTGAVTTFYFTRRDVTRPNLTRPQSGQGT
jgi:hypothetical protein